MTDETLFHPSEGDGRKPWQRSDLESGPSRADHPETSHAAGLTLKGRSIRYEVLRRFAWATPDGLTDEELIDRMRRSPSTIRPRRVELARAGWVTDTGRRRSGRSGRDAIVWDITPSGSRAYEGVKGHGGQRW